MRVTYHTVGLHLSFITLYETSISQRKCL